MQRKLNTDFHLNKRRKCGWMQYDLGEL
jgi:hypothetical protein